MQFNKQPFLANEHIALLKQRNLIINDDSKAEKYLNNIGYFRLSAYFHPFYDSSNTNFKANTSFENILDLYIFDRQLRLLLVDVLERIEIGVRTCISNTMALETKDAHWFMNENIFCNSSEHKNFIREVEKCTNKLSTDKQSPACSHYFKKYKKPDLPPSWVIAECLPMGVWSRVFANLKSKQHKRKIANHFSFSHTDFKSWIHALTIFRNTVAHHSRFWNMNFPPIARNVEKYSYSGVQLNTPYTSFVIIHAFLNRVIEGSAN